MATIFIIGTSFHLPKNSFKHRILDFFNNVLALSIQIYINKYITGLF